VASSNVAARSASAELAGLLDSPEIGQLIERLEATRWTGRPGYPVRAMVGLALVKSLYAIPTWTKTVALVREHWALQRARLRREPAERLRRLSLRGKAPQAWRNGRALHRRRDRGTALQAAELRPRPLHRRERYARLRERPALPLQGRAGTRALLGRRCDLGASFRRLDSEGRRVLRLPHSRRCLLLYRPAGRMGSGDSEGQRIAVLGFAARYGAPSRADGGDRSDGQGLRHRARLLGVRRAGLPADHPLEGNRSGEGGEASAAVLRAWRVALRRVRPQARRVEVALPDRGVQARFDLDQSRPPAPASTPRDEAVEGPLPKASVAWSGCGSIPT
jgi:hypothetical protein